MSRTIDADALMHILESCRDTAPVLGLQSIIAIDDAIQMVIDAPTVPAIPMEWLQLRRDTYKNTITAGNLRVAAVIDQLMRDWQKEQEAQK